jgi:hypothetical protein
VSGITLVEKLSWSKYDNPNQLRRMILECIDVDFEMLEYIFATAAFPNLEVINASDIGRRYLPDTPDNAEMYDCSRLKQAMVDRVSRLRQFAWTRMAYDYDNDTEFTSIRPFGSFRDLERLEDLRIDYNLFADPDVDLGLPALIIDQLHSENVPTGLQSFEIVGADWVDLSEALLMEGDRTEAFAMLRDIFATHPASYISVGLDMGSFQPFGYDHPLVGVLREVVDDFSEHGTALEIRFDRDPEVSSSLFLGCTDSDTPRW